MNHIDHLKALLDFGESERLFGISLHPDHQCPQIDSIIALLSHYKNTKKDTP